MDEVRHRAGGERPHGRHRAGADHVGVDPRRAARVRAPEIRLAEDRDLLGCVADEAFEHLLARERGIAVELRGEHLDPSGRGGEPDLAVDSRERAEQSFGVGSARCAGHAEEDAHGGRLRATRYLGPSEAARKAPIARMFCCPRYEYEPMTLFPNAAGLVMYWTKKAASFVFPIAERFGAPSWPAP